MIRSIRTRTVFEDLRTQGKRVRSGGVRMTFSPQPDPQPMLAFAFGRKFGNAVERNRARRRLRAAFVETWDRRAHPCGAYLISGNRRVLTDDFAGLTAAVGACLAQLRTKTTELAESGATP